MFATFKQIFTPRNKELRKRILFTLCCLAIFIIGTTISIPNTKSLSDNLGFLELLNSIGGGALKRGSIFGLGVMPYAPAGCAGRPWVLNRAWQHPLCGQFMHPGAVRMTNRPRIRVQ